MKNIVSGADSEIERFNKDFEVLRTNLDTGVVISVAKMTEQGFSQVNQKLYNISVVLDRVDQNGKQFFFFFSDENVAFNSRPCL